MMEPTLFTLTGCSTCRKAVAWLRARGIPYAERSITAAPPTPAELAAWVGRDGTLLDGLFNTRGGHYRAWGGVERLTAASVEERMAALAADGMLVRRPLWVFRDRVLVGFREAEWAEAWKGIGQ